ncbi:hypothetical protein HTSR_0326 [Halodesulfurarchaeum formicicum]|uniref:Uncharacterized protein n=1 Tax=Halodesulfurarchaeum formicicum TaxID=1873524 RepID=A0A1D8S2D2_9EURY|nr:hypothetical protein [Halodesulfurarchaeum formicicum]AOW79527.1 hypothetical protein HTSR_0326 [Halodesulfurarchaeum formicicum]APE94779.1 hypothetical protein HSR6_0312 [Halodesulfurarchaeum formicicum]
MEQDTQARLESIVDRLSGDEDVTAEELQEIAEGLETGKKYTCATCQMFCTGEDIMVIYDTENESFLQIEVPMDEAEPLVVTRVD